MLDEEEDDEGEDADDGEVAVDVVAGAALLSDGDPTRPQRASARAATLSSPVKPS